ncbi:MAG: hypothetical protein H8E48_11110, partial [Chloroflexi bacterium]|nr:hypothetical protein [Chloroflexota bacterium]
MIIAVAVVALSIVLRNDMIKTFTGDWIPVGQYLILVSGLATFDARTRGGLYTGLVLSGMVLFFASQQAFDLSFGVFVVGFVVVLLAFMLLTYLEDMIRSAHVYWAKNSAGILVYWIGAICAMFLLAGVAYTSIPRGGNNIFGPPELSVLPYSGTEFEAQPFEAQPQGNPAEQLPKDSPVGIAVNDPADLSSEALDPVQENNTPLDIPVGDTVDTSELTTPKNTETASATPPEVTTLTDEQGERALADLETATADNTPNTGNTSSFSSQNSSSSSSRASSASSQTEDVQSGLEPIRNSFSSGNTGTRTEQTADGPPQSDPGDIPSPVHTTDGNSAGSVSSSQAAASSQTSGGSSGFGGSSNGTQSQVSFSDEAQPEADPVVFHVRSKVASYWRGLVLEDFDGNRWMARDLNNKMIESVGTRGTWYNTENQFSSNDVNYRQTFFVKGNDDLPMITGYRALQVIVNDEQSDDALLTSGSSYSVVSSVPNHSPAQLRSDFSKGLSPELTLLPARLEEQITRLSTMIIGQASTDFEKLGRIMSYMNTETDHVPPGANGLASMATVEEFLFNRKTGSILDYATATVLLARGADLPARLAVGYLPGTRDPLTGTYRVRESDRHAWAEVQFRQTGWVPFDGAPRQNQVYGERPISGLTSWLTSGVSEEVFSSIKGGPQKAFETLTQSVSGPLLWVLTPILGIVMILGIWFHTNSRRRLRNAGSQLLAYATLPGDHRKEVKKIYSEVERLIRRNAGASRAEWQTADDYASIAAGRSEEIGEHLSWFTRAIWQANYRTGELEESLVTEGRRRLDLLKKAF